MRVYVRLLGGAGQFTELAADPGKRLMEVIRNSGLPIRAECGGVAACATCHVYVEGDWLARLPEPAENEKVMLEVADEANRFSRLSCQIRLTGEMDGLQVTLAPGSAP